MAKSIEWRSVGLRLNPFPELTPQTDPGQIVWAGMPKIKTQFEDVFYEALNSRKKQVVLNYGPYGGGKTHAAMYFSDTARLQKLMSSDLRGVHSIYITTPKEGSTADTALYLDIIDSLGISKIIEKTRAEVNAIGEKPASEALRRITKSEEFSKAVVLLGTETDADKLEVLKRYIQLDSTKTERRRIGINREISTTQDKFKVLGAILSCFIGLKKEQRLRDHDRVILWIDEMEDLIYFTAKQYRPFTQGIRDLLDSVTLASPEAVENIKVLFGTALWERISQHIYFDELSAAEGIRYIKDLLKQYRRSSSNFADSYPFQEKGLELLVQSVEKRTPREINRRCNMVLERAAQDGLFTHIDGEKPPIDSHYVKGMAKEIGESESE